MPEPRPPVSLALQWEHELQFIGKVGSFGFPLDGRARAAASPMQLLAAALAGCMSIDLVHILTRGRNTVRSLRTELTGERSTDDPRRFTRVHLRFLVDTDADGEQIDRALALSREKYCSVWQSMRQDIELTVTFEKAQHAVDD